MAVGLRSLLPASPAGRRRRARCQVGGGDRIQHADGVARLDAARRAAGWRRNASKSRPANSRAPRRCRPGWPASPRRTTRRARGTARRAPRGRSAPGHSWPAAGCGPAARGGLVAVVVPREMAEGASPAMRRPGRPRAPAAARRAAGRSCPRWTAPGSCRTTWAPSFRPPRPRRCVPSASSIRARAKACGHSRQRHDAEAERQAQHAPAARTARSRAPRSAGLSVMRGQSFDDAAQVADGARRAAQAVGHIVERLDGHDAVVAARRAAGRAASRRMGAKLHFALARARAGWGRSPAHGAMWPRRHPAGHQRLRSARSPAGRRRCSRSWSCRPGEPIASTICAASRHRVDQVGFARATAARCSRRRRSPRRRRAARAKQSRARGQRLLAARARRHASAAWASRAPGSCRPSARTAPPAAA